MRPPIELVVWVIKEGGRLPVVRVLFLLAAKEESLLRRGSFGQTCYRLAKTIANKGLLENLPSTEPSARTTRATNISVVRISTNWVLV